MKSCPNRRDNALGRCALPFTAGRGEFDSHGATFLNKRKNMEKLFDIPRDDGSICCPLCGSENYEEYEELMYENGIDDPQYGGKLKMVKITDCRDCG